MNQLITPIAAILITTYAIAAQHRQTMQVAIPKPINKNKLDSTKPKFRKL